VHAPTEDKSDDMNNRFYDEPEWYSINSSNTTWKLC